MIAGFTSGLKILRGTMVRSKVVYRNHSVHYRCTKIRLSIDNDDSQKFIILIFLDLGNLVLCWIVFLFTFDDYVTPFIL